MPDANSPPMPVRSAGGDLSAPASANVAEATLSPSAQALAGAALAPATVRAYSAALAALDRWLADQGGAADDAALADYQAARHDAGAAPSTMSSARQSGSRDAVPIPASSSHR